MYVVGLTGGIGSGKSTVARRLVDGGCHVVDADQVAREILEPGSEGLAAVVDRFGPDVVDADGALVRQALADIVFTDPDARADLDGITHPRIRDRIDERLRDHERAEQDESAPRIVVVDHPLLVETGQAEHFPAVIVVVADEETRIERLVAHRGMREDDARARLASQASDDQRIAAATHVVRNDGTVEDLHARTDEVLAELRASAAAQVAS